MSTLESAISSLASRLEKVVSRVEAVERQLAEGGGHSAAGGNQAPAGPASASVQEYEDLINQYIKPYVDLSNKLGDKQTADQAALVLDAVNAQRDLLNIAAQSKKPSDDVLQKLLQPTSELMTKIGAIRDSNRASKFFNNLSTVSEGIQALGWVIVAPTPGPYVGDMRGGSEFYSNRVLKEFKGVNQVQVDWVNAFNGFLKELQAFIKNNHTTGLTWNPKGGDASAAVGHTAPQGPAGPAPPPPLSVDQLNAAVPANTPAPKSGGPDMSGLLSSLNKGEGVTSGLKKVTDDMKSKNRTDKTSVVPAASQPKTQANTSAKNAAPKKPPKFALEGNKWLVEHQVGNREIVINDTEPKQTVYIFKCSNSTVQIKGKVNSVAVDDCDKVAVVFDTVVASFELVNCRSVEVQVTGKVPSIAIDKTSGCQLYLSKDALDTEIVTSKSSEMNVLLPTSDPDQDLVEIAIPEQYKTTVKGGKLHTEIVQHV
jgi:adenylyl cyclase-associated protein